MGLAAELVSWNVDRKQLQYAQQQLEWGAGAQVCESWFGYTSFGLCSTLPLPSPHQQDQNPNMITGEKPDDD